MLLIVKSLGWAHSGCTYIHSAGALMRSSRTRTDVWKNKLPFVMMRAKLWAENHLSRVGMRFLEYLESEAHSSFHLLIFQEHICALQWKKWSLYKFGIIPSKDNWVRSLYKLLIAKSYLEEVKSRASSRVKKKKKKRGNISQWMVVSFDLLK